LRPLIVLALALVLVTCPSKGPANEVLTTVAPAYPPEAMTLGLQDTTVVHLFVGADSLATWRPLEGDSLFIRNIEEVLPHWRFYQKPWVGEGTRTYQTVIWFSFRLVDHWKQAGTTISRSAGSTSCWADVRALRPR
jgi:hypothetical protein